MMKVIKEVTTTGTIDHRAAYFKAALCDGGKDQRKGLVFAVTIQNPEDVVSDIPKVKDILNGRIFKRFEGQGGKRLNYYTEHLHVCEAELYFYSKEVMSAMLNQFKRVKERNLATQLGLKWKPQEGEIVKELSVENPISVENV